MTLPIPAPPGPHRRYNPLTGEWILISAQRTLRPWQGGTEDSSRSPTKMGHDPDCFLCPRNRRAGGEVNPDYVSTYTFTNDYPALLPTDAAPIAAPSPLFVSQTASGTCRVMCFSPNHSLSLANLDVDAIRSVVDMWVRQTEELGNTYRWVQIFENKGEAMGASSPHPHGQVWASSSLPTHAAAEDVQQAMYQVEHASNLLMDYAAAESLASSRLVLENDAWMVSVPYWAIWPFETMIIPKRHVLRFPDLTSDERNSLASILKRLLTRYDNLFEAPFPYSMGWHGAPFGDGPHDHWQLHAHLYPPLLRSASVRKFMVGYELLGEAQRDLTPEQAAGQLRGLSDAHYDDA